ncbi:MAG: hypothetical protein LQ350_005318 [Teloschistes chrysophthalmus]|nr:MAG: hypothetical protein LQ350_005318 [Niorma chrysophthalma]
MSQNLKWDERSERILLEEMVGGEALDMAYLEAKLGRSSSAISQHVAILRRNIRASKANRRGVVHASTTPTNTKTRNLLAKKISKPAKKPSLKNATTVDKIVEKPTVVHKDGNNDTPSKRLRAEENTTGDPLLLGMQPLHQDAAAKKENSEQAL